MPRLSAFDGIVIYMYIRDHGMPHVQAHYAGDRAVVDVATGGVLAGDLRTRQARLVSEWVVLHRTELHAAWQRASTGESPGTSKPL